MLKHALMSGIAAVTLIYSGVAIADIDCSPLDPRVSLSAEKEAKLSASVSSLYKIVKAGGSIQGKLKNEIQNLQKDTPVSEQGQVQLRVLYLFCGTVANAKDISTERKVKLYQEMISRNNHPTPVKQKRKQSEKRIKETKQTYAQSKSSVQPVEAVAGDYVAGNKTVNFSGQIVQTFPNGTPLVNVKDAKIFINDDSDRSMKIIKIVSPANKNYKLSAEDNAYIGAICDAVRKITEQLEGTRLQSEDRVVNSSLTYSKLVSNTSKLYKNFNISSATYVKDMMAIEDRITIDYLNDSTNKVAVVEMKDFGVLRVDGGFSLASFMSALNLDGFTITKSNSDKSGSVLATIIYDNEGHPIIGVGEAAILPQQQE